MSRQVPGKIAGLDQSVTARAPLGGEHGEGAQSHHLVWDLPVRVFHWTLATAFVGAYLTHRLGVNYFRYHLWCGYAVIVLIAFRLIWGVVGTHHAQFAKFVRGPVTTLHYAWSWLRHPREHPVGHNPHVGHNPLGGWMVIALLTMLLAQALTGLFGNDEIFNVGPLYAYVDNDTSLRLTSLHRELFWWLAAAVALHVLAVFIHLIFKKENLIKAMVTGSKPADRVAAHDAIQSSRTGLALVLVIALAAGFTVLVVTAPAPAQTAAYE